MPARRKSSNQAGLIKQAVERSRRNRDAYTRKQAKQLQEELARAARDVRAELGRFEEMVAPTPGQAARLAHLNALKERIDDIAGELEKNLTALVPENVEGAVNLGVRDGIADLKTIKVPGYDALTAPGIDGLAASVFSRIDRSALDFLVNFQIELMGDVADQLKRSIKSRVSSGIIAGKSMPEIARDIGTVIKDEETFRKAGRTVFKSAQHRVNLITRTEVNRAHNQGRMKFYKMAGVKKVQWFATLDKRTAPLDRSYHKQVFDIDKVPDIPLHPLCRCSSCAVNTDFVET